MAVAVILNVDKVMSLVNATVPVLVGSVSVPVLLIVLITGAVNVLFVNVWVEFKSTTSPLPPEIVEPDGRTIELSEAVIVASPKLIEVPLKYMSLNFNYDEPKSYVSFESGVK